jgi:hypothetical protein
LTKRASALGQGFLQTAADQLAQLGNARVSDRIEYLQSLFAARQDVRVRQRLQVTRYVGLRAPGDFCEGIDALLAGEQRLD